MDPTHSARPLKRHESVLAEQMLERAVELAKDSHARTRHAALLVNSGSLLGWGINGVPLPGEDHCFCRAPGPDVHDDCRTHAEQRAINLTREGGGWAQLRGASLIYVRLEADGAVRLNDPHYCARCARTALSLGVAQWIFPLPDGLVAYAAADYDQVAALLW